MPMESRQPPPTGGGGGGGASVSSYGINGTNSGDQYYDHHHHQEEGGVDHPHPGEDVGYYNNLNPVPSEIQLTLLCLDYLRDLLRSLPPNALHEEGLNSDWLSIAVFALQQSFNEETDLYENHDAWKSSMMMMGGAEHQQPPYSPDQLPPLSEIQNMIMEPPEEEEVGGNTANVRGLGRGGSVGTMAAAQMLDAWYDAYEDSHPSNQHRMYSMNGLASRPLYLGELVSVACTSNNIRSRGQAQEEMVQSPLFEQFLHAVESKGFFKNAGNNVHSQLYQERYQKVVAKFRTKLASKSINNNATNGVGADAMMNGGASVTPSLLEGGTVAGDGGDIPLDKTQLLWERHQQRRLQLILESGGGNGGTNNGNAGTGGPLLQITSGSSMDDHHHHHQQYDHQDQGGGGGGGGGAEPPAVLASNKTTPTINTANANEPPGAQGGPPSPLSPLHNPEDLEKAENLKTQGNAAMQRKSYQEAADAYTAALQLSPDGPNSHVYFSNRAAALLSQKEFQKAIWDSERALRLKPNYAKAHARLGLAHFLLGDYRLAMEAYTVALKYEPDNKSSKSYLEKAAKRLAQQQQQQNAGNERQHHQQQPGGAVAGGHAGTDYNGAGPGGGQQPPADNNNAPMSFSVVSEWEKNKQRQVQNQNMTPQDVAVRDAEKYKVKGNQYMANRDYESALACYSSAIGKSSEGPQSHVYYSNRAAALCYLERYEDAALDSEMSIQLQPTYGKAYARLGLSRFFLNDYRGAVEAYEKALFYDPDNAASKSYLAKAKLKVKAQQQQEAVDGMNSPSVEAEARRLMDDPHMQMMAKKAMNNTNPQHRPLTPQNMMDDPEMQFIARKAMNDPTMMEAVMAVSTGSVNLSNGGSRPGSRSGTPSGTPERRKASPYASPARSRGTPSPHRSRGTPSPHRSRNTASPHRNYM